MDQCVRICQAILPSDRQPPPSGFATNPEHHIVSFFEAWIFAPSFVRIIRLVDFGEHEVVASGFAVSFNLFKNLFSFGFGKTTRRDAFDWGYEPGRAAHT